MNKVKWAKHWHDRGFSVVPVHYVKTDGSCSCSGSPAGLNRLTLLAKQAKALKVKQLQVSGGFHSAFMKPAVSLLSEALDKVQFHAPKITVISNVTGRPHSSNPDNIKQALLDQLTSPVLWSQTMESFIVAGLEECYEMGPGLVCTQIARRASRQSGQTVTCHAADKDFM